MIPTDLAIRLSEFLTQYLPQQRGVSSNTIKAYRDTFKLLLTYCHQARGIAPEKLHIDHLDVARIVDFLGYLEDVRRSSKPTRNQRLAAIHSFFRFLQARSPEHILQCQQILAVPFHRQEHRPPRYLEPEELATILAQPDIRVKSGRRDTVLLSVLYDTAARVQELVDLRVGDVRLQSPGHVRPTGKGRKVRFVPLMPNTVTLLRSYLEENRLLTPDKDARRLFVNRTGQPLSCSGVRYIVGKYTQLAAGVYPGLSERVSPHTFRHSKAMHLLQAGNPLIIIRDVLGHVDVRTTEVYARADVEMQRRAFEKAAPSAPHAPGPLSWQSDKSLLEWLQSL